MKQLLPVLSLFLLLLLLSPSVQSQNNPCNNPSEAGFDAYVQLINLLDLSADAGTDLRLCVPAFLPVSVSFSDPQGEGAQVRVTAYSEDFETPFINGQTLEDAGPILIPFGLSQIGLDLDFLSAGSFRVDFNTLLGSFGGRVQIVGAAPVTWTKDLAYEPYGEQIKLHWSVAEQVDVSGYELERMRADQSFEKVADIPYQENGSLEVDYDILTPWPVQGTYYRIKQLDYAGTYDYSNVVFVEGNDAAVQEFDIFPNPASTTVRMSVPEGIRTVDLISASGQVVKTFTANEVRREGMDVSSVSAGMYLVRPVGDNGAAKPQRLVVSH